VSIEEMTIMRAEQMLRFLNDQHQELQDLIGQLDEIQVRFNAQYDSFKSKHDATLDRGTDRIAQDLEAVSPERREAIGKNQQR